MRQVAAQAFRWEIEENGAVFFCGKVTPGRIAPSDIGEADDA